MSVLIAIGISTLVSDSVLHLIPHVILQIVFMYIITLYVMFRHLKKKKKQGMDMIIVVKENTIMTKQLFGEDVVCWLGSSSCTCLSLC